MKKLQMLTFFLSFVITNCFVLNPLGLSVNREKGSDAKDRITVAAVVADALFTKVVSTRIVGQPIIDINVLSLVAGDLAGIEDDKYYLRDDVDGCILEIQNVAQWFDLSPFIPTLFCGNIRGDDMLIGHPLNAL